TLRVPATSTLFPYTTLFRSHVGHLPAMHPRGQAEPRALVRHVGEAEAPIAIGVDADAMGEMAGGDDLISHDVVPANAGTPVCCGGPGHRHSRSGGMAVMPQRP